MISKNIFVHGAYRKPDIITKKQINESWYFLHHMIAIGNPEVSFLWTNLYSTILANSFKLLSLRPESMMNRLTSRKVYHDHPRRTQGHHTDDVESAK